MSFPDDGGQRDAGRLESDLRDAQREILASMAEQEEAAARLAAMRRETETKQRSIDDLGREKLRRSDRKQLAAMQQDLDDNRQRLDEQHQRLRSASAKAAEQLREVEAALEKLQRFR